MGGPFKDSIDFEAIERRGTLRGFLYAVRAELDNGFAGEVLEASETGLFVGLDDPDSYKLRESHNIKVSHGDVIIRLRVEVVRKEVDPRRGVALRINHVSDDDAFEWRKILASAQKTVTDN
jgi:hypothetical protein